jgi:uncharacterized protein YdhG (YjbR/CyaY superfamily)
MYKTIDEYISQFPAELQEKLQTLRKVIKDAAPESQEKISWGMPTFVLHGNLVHFAAFKKHIGFYPTSTGVEHFKDELTDYKFSKGAIQFDLTKPIPYELIDRIVRFRVKENIALAEEKLNKKHK